MPDPLATGLAFQPMRFARNRLSHTIPAADPALQSRVGLAYLLSIEVPEHPLSETFVELHTSEGREKPVVTEQGTSVYEGAEFRFNERNGKLDGLLECTKPRYRQDQMSALVGQTRRFRLRERVTGGSPPVGTDVTLPVEWVIKAGLDEEDFAAYGETFWSTYQAQARRFLTWQPDGATLGREAEAYLFFLLNFRPEPAEVRLRVETVSRAGVVSGPFTARTLSGAGFGQVVCAPVGPDILGLDDDVVRYRVWLSDEQNRRLSEVRTYHLPRRPPEQERYLLLSNSLGGWDTLRLTGEATQTLRVQQVLAERDRPAGAPLDFNESFVVSTEGERELTIASGYLPGSPWLRYLGEVLLSEDLYLVDPKGHLPLRRTTNTLVDRADRPELPARTLTFVKGLRLDSYSDLPPLPPGPAPNTRWAGFDYVPLLDAAGKRTGQAVATRLRRVLADTGEPFRPLTTKPNAPGDPDYESPRPAPNFAAGTTPFPSAAINRPTTFRRTTCTGGDEGGPAQIAIPAGAFGGETQADADARADAEYQRLNTQATANALGTCTPVGNYDWPVPAGFWHYRANRPLQVGVANIGQPMIGNLAALPAGPHVYAPGSNDLDFPLADYVAGLWGLYLYGPAGSTRRLRLYRNGVLYLDETFVIPPSGYAERQLARYSPAPVIEPASGDKFFIQLLDA